MSNISTILQLARRGKSARAASEARLLAAVVLVLAGLSFSACGSSESSNKGSDILRTGLTADPSPLDPDTYYEAEGLAITTSVYEGLLRYES